MEDDEKELREWMELNIGGLRSDRSTASYALEFLKTAHSNIKKARACVSIALALEGLNGHISWLKEGIERLEKIKE